MNGLQNLWNRRWEAGFPREYWLWRCCPDAGGGRTGQSADEKLVDRHRKNEQQYCDRLRILCAHKAVTAVFLVGGMVIVGAIPVLSSAVRTLPLPAVRIAVVAGLAAQEALGSSGQRRMIPRICRLRWAMSCAMSITTSPAACEEITLHHTAVRTFENKRVIIPNSKMNSAIIENADYADSKVCVFPDSGDYLRKRPKKPKSCLAREVRKQPTFRYSHRAAKGRRARCAGRCA